MQRPLKCQWITVGPLGMVSHTQAAASVLGKSGDAPCNLVSIFGGARQGKSFLMNCLAGADSLFQISNSMDPCTQGIDLSSTLMSLKQFSEVHGGSPVGHTSAMVGFVDAEGQGDRDESYDAKIVCPILLCSKAVIFNWKDSLQKDRLLKLLAVMQRAALNVMPTEGAGGSRVFGHLHIVFRDWQYEGTPDTVWDVLFKPERSSNPDVALRNEIRRVLIESFESTRVWLFPPPGGPHGAELTYHRTSEEFRASVRNLRAALCEQLKTPLMFNNRQLKGRDLPELVHACVETLNRGETIVPQSAYVMMLKAEAEREKESLVQKARVAAHELCQRIQDKPLQSQAQVISTLKTELDRLAQTLRDVLEERRALIGGSADELLAERMMLQFQEECNRLTADVLRAYADAIGTEAQAMAQSAEQKVNRLVEEIMKLLPMSADEILGKFTSATREFLQPLENLLEIQGSSNLRVQDTLKRVREMIQAKTDYTLTQNEKTLTEGGKEAKALAEQHAETYRAECDTLDLSRDFPSPLAFVARMNETRESVKLRLQKSLQSRRLAFHQENCMKTFVQLCTASDGKLQDCYITEFERLSKSLYAKVVADLSSWLLDFMPSDGANQQTLHETLLAASRKFFADSSLCPTRWEPELAGCSNRSVLDLNSKLQDLWLVHFQRPYDKFMEQTWSNVRRKNIDMVKKDIESRRDSILQQARGFAQQLCNHVQDKPLQSQTQVMSSLKKELDKLAQTLHKVLAERRALVDGSADELQAEGMMLQFADERNRLTANVQQAYSDAIGVEARAMSHSAEQKVNRLVEDFLKLLPLSSDEITRKFINITRDLLHPLENLLEIQDNSNVAVQDSLKRMREMIQAKTDYILAQNEKTVTESGKEAKVLAEQYAQTFRQSLRAAIDALVSQQFPSPLSLVTSVYDVSASVKEQLQSRLQSRKDWKVHAESSMNVFVELCEAVGVEVKNQYVSDFTNLAQNLYTKAASDMSSCVVGLIPSHRMDEDTLYQELQNCSEQLRSEILRSQGLNIDAWDEHLATIACEDHGVIELQSQLRILWDEHFQNPYNELFRKTWASIQRKNSALPLAHPATVVTNPEPDISQDDQSEMEVERPQKRSRRSSTNAVETKDEQNPVVPSRRRSGKQVAEEVKQSSDNSNTSPARHNSKKRKSVSVAEAREEARRNAQERQESRINSLYKKS